MEHAGFPNGIGIDVSKIIDSIKKENAHKKTLIIEIDNTPIVEMNYKTVFASVAEIGIKICNFDYQEKGLGR